jgi:acyl-CoA thioester hydrolase
MRPRPLRTEPLANDPRYVRDGGTGLVYHRLEHRVIYADTDRSGVVYHANYFRYFEVGRATLLRDAKFPYRVVEESGFVYPIYKLGCDFHAALHYDDAMWVHTRFRMLEGVRVGFDYAITHVGAADVVCTGFTLHCATNGKGQPVAVDPMTVQVYESFPKQ